MIHSGKNVLVLGLGHSGQAAAQLLLEEGARVTVLESSDSPDLREKATGLEALGGRVILGPGADAFDMTADLAVISPGIAPDAPLVRAVVKKGVPLIGELELAYEECLCPVVAITGTNGKTTTTELTTAMLRGAGVRTMASGNIGLPFATAVRQSGELDVMVLEVSSFQLETIRAFRPHVAAWLNLSPNHLDRYVGVADYRAAKLRIFENQTDRDFAVVNAVNDLPRLKARTITFSARASDGDFSLVDGWILHRGERIIEQAATRLPGFHNAENLMAALAIGHALDVDLPRLAEAVGDYAPPSHRCEPAGEHRGVKWINDSKATNLDSVAMAIRSQQGPVILIAGGKDKGFEFDDLLPLVRQRVRTAVLIGEMRERIARSWVGVDCHLADSLEEAVLKADLLAEPGDTVLFSPGTSSFDMFRNYGERGNRFKEAVAALPLKKESRKEKRKP
ncbi:MAG: UDP-N-acetylmuramoyl-L-alanine--D-glutamate ligase [Terrimicrobiaceae bacterium]